MLPALISVESSVDAVHHPLPSLGVPHRVEQRFVLSLQVGRQLDNFRERAAGGCHGRVVRVVLELELTRICADHHCAAFTLGRCEISIPYFRAAALMRRHAASRSELVTPSTWSKRAIALRT